MTLSAKSGTATAGRDFSGDPVTACWEDQEEDWQLIDLPIFEDSRQEGFENFTLELSNPTGRRRHRADRIRDDYSRDND